jgi:hypothetical protein
MKIAIGNGCPDYLAKGKNGAWYHDVYCPEAD